MEDILTQINQDASSSKYSHIKKACQDATDILKDPQMASAIEPYRLREVCLVPLRLALESKNNRFATLALGGMQKMLTDERFLSAMEAEAEERWLPMQILSAVSNVPNCSEETQVEVLKVLLLMTLTSSWCMNAKVITRITEFCFDLYLSTSKSGLRGAVVSTFLRLLHAFSQGHTRHHNGVDEKVLVAMYGEGCHGSVRTAAQATLTQLLTSLATRVNEAPPTDEIQSDNADELIAEFSSGRSAHVTQVLDDVIHILHYLSDKLFHCGAGRGGPGGGGGTGGNGKDPELRRQTIPLLLEGILAILSNVPVSINQNQAFVDIIWKLLCPSLISALGNPLADKSVVHNKAGTGSGSEDQGRGSGCSNNAPNVNTGAAKSVYSICKELIRLIGRLESLRPVLESLLHRMLLYPPPQHRLEAIKSLSETLGTPERLLDLAGPTQLDNSQNTVVVGKRKGHSNIAPLKLIVDSLQECSHCNDSAVCMTSVDLVADLVTSLDLLSKGQGVSDDLIVDLHKHCASMEGLNSTMPNSIHSSISKESHQNGHIAEESGSAHESDDSDSTDGYDTSCSQQNSSDNQSNTQTDGQNSDDNPANRKTDRQNGSDGHTNAQSNHVNEGNQKKNGIEKDVSMTRLNGLSNRAQIEQLERDSAKQYVNKLTTSLSEWLTGFTCREVDEMIQHFSSDFCTAQSCDEQGQSVVLNADAVYVVTYSTLLLNLKLIRNGYYESDEKSLHIAEHQFISSLLCTELKLYVSAAWLSEVFHQVIHHSLLEEAGYRDMGVEDCEENKLIQLLIDIDGLDSRKISGQFLCGYRDKEAEGISSETSMPENKNPLAVQAGQQFSRQIVRVCGDQLVDVLSVLLSGQSACGLSGSLALMFNAKEETRKAQEAICTSLAALRNIAKLSCVLGVQERCGKVFAELAAASCILEPNNKQRDQPQPKSSNLPFPSSNTKSRVEKLHAAHALSLDLVLSVGLEMGSHAPNCWLHVFRCCAHISSLEHTYFSSTGSQPGYAQVKREKQQPDELFHYSVDPNDGDLYSSMMGPCEHVPRTLNVSDLIGSSRTRGGGKGSSSTGSGTWDGSALSGAGRIVLTAENTAKVICALSQQVDTLFEDATNCLNQKALVNFLAGLCQASKHQLSQYGRNPDNAAHSNPPSNALHLYRLGDVLLRCMRGDRPLLHIMQCWAVVSPHLVEAACHKDRKISKKAVSCLHETVTWLLSNRDELPHFHFNELLCKPYENLVCLELCDGDVQDQIVCSVCELVEACSTEIRSGWRALFSALRAVRIKYTTNEEVNEARQRHITAVLDVFDVFLNSENTLVFANAALDCIQCLHKYVRGQGEFEDIADDDSDSGSDSGNASSDTLILPALRYLKQCCVLLSSMWTMPACPVFHSAKSIQIASKPAVVDPIIPGYDFEAFQKPFKNSRDKTPPPEEHVEDVIRADVKTCPENSDVTQNGCNQNGGGKIGVQNGDETDSVRSLDTESISSSGADDSQNTAVKDSSQDVKNENTDNLNSKNSTNPADSNASSYSTLPHASATEGVDFTAQQETLDELLKYYDDSKDVIDYKAKSLAELDRSTGVLHVWYLVLEGLAGTVAECPRNYQPQALEMLFELMRLAADQPGAEFALHCMNHLLLPNLQSWLRKGNQMVGYWTPHTISNFKHCFGLCADLVVEYVIRFVDAEEHQGATEFMLKQTLDLMTECVAQPHEALSRLGCACIRHSLLSCGALLTEHMWHIAVQALRHACDVKLHSLLSCGALLTEHMWHIAVQALRHAWDVTLYCLKQLMTPFQQDSDNFYGDIGQVKVAVRKDCSGIECERLRQLAQQVFLLDSQRSRGLVVDYAVEEDRSYIFLIYPPGVADSTDPAAVSRVSLRSIVVGLLSHQILIQTLGCVLLQGSVNMVSGERDVLQDGAASQQDGLQDTEQDTPQLPGLMRYMSTRNVLNLLDCLHTSYTTAQMFDSRPGLKFLMQKVARSDVATNLYKQMGMSFTFYVHALLEIATRHEHVTLDKVKAMLHEVHVSEQSARDNISLSANMETSVSDNKGNSVSDNKATSVSDNKDTSVSDNKETLVGDKKGIKESVVGDNKEEKDKSSQSASHKDTKSTSLHPKSLSLTQLAKHSTAPIEKHVAVFTAKLKRALDSICTDYIDMYLEKEGPSQADELSGKLLVFLVSPMEEVAPSVRRDASLREMTRDKLRERAEKLQKGGDETGETTLGVTRAVQQQGEDETGLESACAAEDSDDVTQVCGPVPAHEELDARVYSVATDRTINTLMSQYKRRKQAQTMPAFVKQGRSAEATNRLNVASKRPTPTPDPRDHQIQQDHAQSIVKDGVAQLGAYVEAICNALRLFLQLDDAQLRAQLPVLFHACAQLTCHGRARALRDTLAHVTWRLGHMYGFAPIDSGMNCPKCQYD